MPADESAFDELYASHLQALHAYFIAKTSDPELALDLTQEAFIRAWRNIASLNGLPRERQAAWLFTVARHLVVDAVRARSTRQSTDEALKREALTREATAPPADSRIAEQDERIQAVELAIQGLPEDLRVVLVLQVLGGRTSAEIGELLDRPAGTVRYQQAEARRRLAHELRLTGAVS